jgi:hypothetical protein
VLESDRGASESADPAMPRRRIKVGERPSARASIGRDRGIDIATICGDFDLHSGARLDFETGGVMIEAGERFEEMLRCRSTFAIPTRRTRS